jgi:Holliday junction DNA helicase RuvB
MGMTFSNHWTPTVAKNSSNNLTAPDSLRPATLLEFSGQPDVIRELNIVLSAAKGRNELCDHILFSGPPGLGKTTLAGIVANELGLHMVATSGPAIERPGELISLLVGLAPRSCVFIDEIHRLPKACEETLYTAMEDGYIDLMLGDGAKARTQRLNLDPFLLIGATTLAGMLSDPLRARFGFSPRLRLYDDAALATIVLRSAKLLGLSISSDAAQVIASRSKCTPREANRLLRRVRDWSQVQGVANIDVPTTEAALDAFGVDTLGLDHLGREILRALVEKFGGGPVGIGTIAASVGEAKRTLEEAYEPFLMHSGLIMRTRAGRVATDLAWGHLGLSAPAQAIVERSEVAEPTLFGEL